MRYLAGDNSNLGVGVNKGLLVNPANILQSTGTAGILGPQVGRVRRFRFRRRFHHRVTFAQAPEAELRSIPDRQQRPWVQALSADP